RGVHRRRGVAPRVAAPHGRARRQVHTGGRGGALEHASGPCLARRAAAAGVPRRSGVPAPGTDILDGPLVVAVAAGPAIVRTGACARDARARGKVSAGPFTAARARRPDRSTGRDRPVAQCAAHWPRVRACPPAERLLRRAADGGAPLFRRAGAGGRELLLRSDVGRDAGAGVVLLVAVARFTAGRLAARSRALARMVRDHAPVERAGVRV